MAFEKTNHPIKEEWHDYYIMLEAIRRSGICNMFGASPVLAQVTGISEREARDILGSWMANYDELCALWPEGEDLKFSENNLF